MTHRPKPKKQISVPLVLYDCVVGKSDNEWINVERTSIVDAHLSNIEARKLLRMLEEHINSPFGEMGVLGIRFTGRMVL